MLDERRVLAQDRHLELAELGAEVEPDLVGEGAPRLVDRPQCLGLASRPVLGEREQCPATFAQWLLGDQPTKLGEELEVMSRLERRVDTQLLGLAARSVEPDGRGPARLPVFEVDERPPTPELQGPAEQVAGPLRLAEGELQARLAEQLLEPLGIDVTRRHLESIAVAGRLDRLAAERLAQSDDGTLHDLHR